MIRMMSRFLASAEFNDSATASGFPGATGTAASDHILGAYEVSFLAIFS